jgi:DNA-binding NarL/FixJ family response regulator
MSIRVLLVDDFTLLRQGVRALLDKTEDICVIADAENGSEALRLNSELHPDVVIVDIYLPDISGMEVTRRIKDENPDAFILVLSMHTDRRYIAKIMNSGASGYLPKNCSAAELAVAIRVVSSGSSYLGQVDVCTVDNNFVSHGAESRSKLPSICKLTSREKEILQLFAGGESTKEIAFELGLSIKTVETHRQHIMRKLQLFNIADLTRYAIREGLASLS